MSIIRKFIRGAAGTAADLKKDEIQQNMRAKVLAERDERLAAIDTERQATQNAFTAGENQKNRESREQIAKTQAESRGAFGNRYKVAQGQIFDTKQNEFIDMPTDKAEINKLAAKMAKDSMEEMPDDPEADYKRLFDEYVLMLSGEEQPNPGGDGGDNTGTNLEKEIGKIYQNAKGEKARWTANGWERVGG